MPVGSRLPWAWSVAEGMTSTWIAQQLQKATPSNLAYLLYRVEKAGSNEEKVKILRSDPTMVSGHHL